jgi:CheY-like chemotaxis protein
LQTRSLNSLRILVAEDDKVNQALAKAILKKIGCSYTIVDTGLKILETLKNSSYDLILMDIEMPDMDGYQATAKIRSQDTTTQSAIPIIAITAHVSEKELKKCLEVGMNDYIFKPIKLQELLKKIKTVIDIDESILEEPADLNQEDTKVFSLENLSAACGNNLVVAKNIVKLFLAQTPANMKQLNDYLHQFDWSAFKNHCHKMKAVYALLGFQDVKKYLEEMENDCAQNNVNIVKFESYLALIQDANTAIIQSLEQALITEK